MKKHIKKFKIDEKPIYHNLYRHSKALMPFAILILLEQAMQSLSTEQKHSKLLD
jgi:hypothetical protein